MAAQTNTGTNPAGRCPAPKRLTKKQIENFEENRMNGYVGKIEARTDALDLVRVGVRLTYVRAMTGLPALLLRELWRDVHGERPASGRTYCDPLSGLKTCKQRQEASTFANLYFKGDGERQKVKSLEARRFLQVWALFQGSFPGARMDPNLGWTIIRNICAHVTWREKCGHCQVSFIRHVEQSGRTARCPFCAAR